MKIFLSIAIAIGFHFNVVGQGTKEKLLKELAENSCGCIDSISVYNKSKEKVSEEISGCIDKRIGAYQLGQKLAGLDSLIQKPKENDGKEAINISINLDKKSDEYQNAYFELERYLMANCKPLSDKVKASDKQSEKSFSNNTESLAQYSKGVDEMKKGNLKNAIGYYKKAVEIDPNFSFAWDNIGICYRKLGDYDEALNAYKKSLEIDPNGLMPLQNIAIVYEYKKEYDQSIIAYTKLAELDKNNPEVYYGIGRTYAIHLNDYERGLDNMCKAYNLYIQQKSPYRTDAEKVIQEIYFEMKKQGKEKRFDEILKSHHIKPF